MRCGLHGPLSYHPYIPLTFFPFFFLPDSRNHCPLIPDFLLTKPLNIPLLTINRSRQHRSDLIHQEQEGRPTAKPTGDKEAEPFDPLGQVVRVQHIPEQSGLGDLVVLPGRARFDATTGALLLGEPFLALLLATADLA